LNLTAEKFIEEDGSITLSLNEMDLIENEQTEEAAVLTLAQSILEYAKDFYGEFDLWSKAPNRNDHIPDIINALMLDNINKIASCIKLA